MPWIVAVHAGGVQVFSTVEALQSLADADDDPFDRARHLVQLGDLVSAIAALEAVDLDARPELREPVESRLLTWSGELALAMASHGEREQALATLDRCYQRLTLPDLQSRWHLDRIEVFRALGDLDAVQREQDVLLTLPRKE